MAAADYITAYRAAHERHDRQACDDIFASVPDEHVLEVHRAIQVFDPVEPVTVDFMQAADTLMRHGADAEDAAFIASLAANMPIQ